MKYLRNITEYLLSKFRLVTVIQFSRDQLQNYHYCVVLSNYVVFIVLPSHCVLKPVTHDTENGR